MTRTWSFAVAGDSRNCGDIIMPAIAADAMQHNVAFYWHLGDLRAIGAPDQDFVAERRNQGTTTNLAEYEKDAWSDFIANQVKPARHNAKEAKTNVYGYLLATVNPSGEAPGKIDLHFQELQENSVPDAVVERFSKKVVHECFVGNRRMPLIR